MSYLVSILRSKNGTFFPIKLEEVRSAINGLDDWKYHEHERTFVAQNDGKESCALSLEKGELWTKNPSPWALEKMINLAGSLDARVRGDEFETYETVDRYYIHPDDENIKRKAAAAGQELVQASLREQRLIRAAIIGFFVLLGVVVYFIGASFEE